MQTAKKEERVVAASDVEIRPVTSKQDLKDFINVPKKLYRRGSMYVPRLDFEMMDHLSKKNPYFKNAAHCFFVAYKNGNAVGRISAQKDKNATEGHFGFLDADNPETLEALLDTAENWLREKNITKVIGPFSLSVNDESGLLVEGFDSRPRLMMNYAPAWYGNILEDYGYTKAKDLIAYEVNVSGELPKAAQKIAAQTAQMANIEERKINMAKLNKELEIITTIFNDAWQNNWGFMPFNDDDIRYMAKNMKPVIQPDLARLAFIDGKPAGMIVALPDINEAIYDLNGKLFPFGWAKLLWRLKIRGLKSARVLLMGVNSEWQGSPLSAGLSALLISRLQSAAQRLGYWSIEMSWVLEDNMQTDRLIRMMGGKPYKRYRLYQKDIG